MKVSITKCPHCGKKNSEGKKFYIKKGYFKTLWNRQHVPRYQCKSCKKLFSSHTLLPTYRQKKPYLNKGVLGWYSSATTLRGMAKVIGVDRKTIVRKFLFMARQARLEHEKRIEAGEIKTSWVQFDEMETFEHSRLKPLSITIAVRAKTGQVIEAQVATMNCHGKMATISQQKYGWRQDTRDAAREDVLKMVNKCAKDNITIVSDKKTDYPALVSRWVPNAILTQVDNIKTKRTKIINRRNQNDSLFAVNHVAAKIRHNMSRMARKVWVTTKRQWALQAHLDLYIAWVNGYKICGVSDKV